MSGRRKEKMANISTVFLVQHPLLGRKERVSLPVHWRKRRPSNQLKGGNKCLGLPCLFRKLRSEVRTTRRRLRLAASDWRVGHLQTSLLDLELGIDVMNQCQYT